MDPIKLKGIQEWPVPKTAKEVRKFIGFTNFYQKFINNFSHIAKSMNNLLRKTKNFQWTEEAQKSFEELKEAFTKTPVLQMIDDTKPFEIQCDASAYTTGAVLLQEDTNGNKHPVAYHSRALNPAEWNYHTSDREFLAIIRALTEWRQYLEGTEYPVVIWSDHENLTRFKQPQHLNRRQARWTLFLQRFNYIIKHFKGEKNVLADTLSRRPDHQPEGVDNEDVVAIPPENFVNFISEDIEMEIKNNQSKIDNPDKYDKGEDGLLYKSHHIVIPDDLELKQAILRKVHDHKTSGHPGIRETFRKLSQEVIWPGMATFVANYIKGCPICQQFKINRKPVKPPMQPISGPKDTRPFTQISMDLITNLPKDGDKDAILSIVDHGLMKGIILVPTNKTATSSEIADILIDKLFSKYGVPNKVISDRDPRFASKAMKQFYNKLNIEPMISTAYHPQTDGTTE